MKPQNDFQSLMRKWSSLGPYNVVHLVRISGEANPGRWRESAIQPLQELGFEAPRMIETKQVGFNASIEEELNQPFAKGEIPLRFFTIANSDDTHWFGVTYDHWIADCQSIRSLMRRIFFNYTGSDSGSPLPPLRICETPFRELFGETNWISSAIECIRQYLGHLRAFRIGIPEPLDFKSGFQLRQFPDGSIHRIYQLAKENRCTVNDLFLAAVAQTMGDLTAAERAKKRSRFLLPVRNRVALSVVVDIRSLARRSMEGEFGLVFSYFNSVTDAPESVPLPELAARIGTRTHSIKSRRRTLRFFRTFKIANAWWDACRKPWRKALMFHRVLPVLGGISNVNLTDSWIGREQCALDYLRVSPAGPIVPIVFAFTTNGGRLTLCVTYRKTVFSSEQAAVITDEVVRRLDSIGAH